MRPSEVVLEALLAACPWSVVVGDNRKILKELPDNTFDALVTDPPAGIGFMGSKWDDDKGGRTQWVSWLTGVARECLRIMKPGAQGLVWAIPRTSHWTAMALEDAGFEVRDRVAHLFGTGFPKSVNAGRQIDMAQCTLSGRHYDKNLPRKRNRKDGDHLCAPHPAGDPWRGHGTALKPAVEDWWLVRKPLAGTVAANIQAYGTGALNIGACRVQVPADDQNKRGSRGLGRSSGGYQSGGYVGGSLTKRIKETQQHDGRWPAHLTLDEEAAAQLDAQSGKLVSGNGKAPRRLKRSGMGYGSRATGNEGRTYDDCGGASRFLYIAKPTRSERDTGCEGLPVRSGGEATHRKAGSAGLKNPRAGAGRGGGARNFHPTVKRVALMSWLCRLITPPGGVVLDPFAGSGSTGVAALEEGFRFVGVELKEEYAEIARHRLESTELYSQATRGLQRNLFSASTKKRRTTGPTRRAAPPSPTQRKRRTS